MIVEVLGPDDVRVVDVDDLRRLHLALGVVEPAEADAALRAAGLGRLDGEAGLLDVVALRAAAQPHSQDPDWADRWESMLAFARGRGWVADEGRSLEVHVESAAG